MSQSSSSAETPVDEDTYGYFIFMQGVHEEDTIYDLTSVQFGVLLTFAPPSKSFIMDQALKSRRGAHIYIVYSSLCLLPHFAAVQ